MTILWFFLAALGALGLAACLAAVDAALSVVSHHEISDLAAEGSRAADRTLRILGDLPTHLNVLIFTRMLFEAGATVFIVYGYTGAFGQAWEVMLASVLTAAIAVFVISGVSPRTIGRRRSTQVSLALSGVVFGLRRALGPVARVFVWLGNMLTPDRVYRDGPFVSESQLRDLVDRASAGNVIEDDERDMIESVFNLGDTRAYKVMVPRTDLVVLDAETPLRRALSLFLRSGFSRIPVIGEDMDDVRGVLYLKDVVRRVHVHPEDDAEPAWMLARQVPFVPDTVAVDALLHRMQAESRHVVVVVDEYGGTAGVVTIEDIVEEIFGEIDDEYDHQDADIEELEPGTFRVSVRMQIEDLADFFDVRIDQEDVSTVGGLLTTLIGLVPIAGSTAQIAGLRITAEAGQGRRHRVEHVIITRVGPPAAHTEEGQHQ
ncbi:hemolysin family protein [Brevibacterium sp. 50QC2O2]|uniref:hemolysin family protein n=1 Tax=Brevibacterium TaxID=1696 RepID=UPI00211CC36F|nr:hemolysin family protein [Brevibacterium sp. 91QC2O2]MCQ9384076.1 hemolysin family protein [Brevibacterium sp. 68QC2CO]MCQ9388446.1 hemolysin family protein [Brevibacterium sp. 50QC2O2]